MKKYGDDIKQLVLEIAKKSSFNVTEMEIDKDHIHLMVESVPKLSLLQTVRRLKQETTANIWKLHPKLENYFWRQKTF